MACCKVCCGCKECDEGEEGKCCCGSECCAPDTYCCNAECVEACSEGQEGDCKCTDACCYQDEYCCDGECVEACGEGGAGPCKCDSTCCADGEYCCDGECQEEPCGCQPCECEVPESGDGIYYGTCVVSGGACSGDLAAFEFTGVGADMGVQWADGYLAANEGCTLISQSCANFLSEPDSSVFSRIFKCDGGEWVNVSDDALVSDGATNLGGMWSTGGDVSLGDCAFSAPPCEEPCVTDGDCQGEERCCRTSPDNEIGCGKRWQEYFIEVGDCSGLLCTLCAEGETEIKVGPFPNCPDATAAMQSAAAGCGGYETDCYECPNGFYAFACCPESPP
jgi:hypothetical protein